MMRIKNFMAVLCAAALSFGAQVWAAPATDSKTKKKTEEVQDTTSKKKAAKTPYEKLTADFKESAKGGFINLYKNSKDKVFIEYKKENLGRRMLAGGTVRSVTDPTSINVGYKYADPLCFTFELQDSVVLIKTPQLGASTDDPQMAKAMERNYAPLTYSRLSVSAFSPDSSSFFFDATELINALQPKTKEFSPVKATDQSAWTGEMKSFEDNASIVMHYNMETNRSILGIKIPTGSGSMSATVSFLLLPETLMKPRLQDSRIGVFSTGNVNGGARYNISTEADGFKSYLLANRWRVEPADTAAWLAGKLTPVKKQIVWYIDDAFPQDWKAPIRQGILNWNIAFEKLGLKDVMAVKDFPTAEEDPEFDPDNLKYTCIRYIPNSTKNAMGPSWVDPVTGEILNASVLLYNDVVKLINDWRFVQTAQVDERVRAKKLPKDVFDESMEYVVCHEVGHTLGLMHNMGASAAIPVDSLRSTSFTNRYGTTYSIMDYARFNYVAQPSDKGVRLCPPTLGIYDEYAIDWLYRPVPGARDMWEEARTASKIIEEKAGDPRYAYVAQQLSGSTYGEYDPSGRSEDLGDDPVKAGEYGISNLKFILSNLNEWISDDPDRSHRTELYNQIANQYNRYLNNVLAQVGGIYLRQVKEGGFTMPVTTVPASVQEKSLDWVIERVGNAGWIDDRSVTAGFVLHVPISNSIASAVASQLTSAVPDRVQLAACNAPEGDSYKITDYYDDLFDALFKDSGLTSQMMTLQRLVVQGCTKSSSGLSLKLSLVDGQEIEEGPEADSFGEGRAPYQKKVDTKSIDLKDGCTAIFLKKVAKVAGKRRNSGSAEARAHYEALYRLATAATVK